MVEPSSRHSSLHSVVIDPLPETLRRHIKIGRFPSGSNEKTRRFKNKQCGRFHHRPTNLCPRAEHNCLLRANRDPRLGPRSSSIALHKKISACRLNDMLEADLLTIERWTCSGILICELLLAAVQVVTVNVNNGTKAGEVTQMLTLRPIRYLAGAKCRLAIDRLQYFPQQLCSDKFADKR